MFTIVALSSALFAASSAAPDVLAQHTNPNAVNSERWAAADNTDPGFYFAADTTHYGPSSSQGGILDPTYLGFKIEDVLSTGLSVVATIFLLVFSFTFLGNAFEYFLDSALVDKLFKRAGRGKDGEDARSLDVDEVARITEQIYQAYKMYTTKQD